MKVDLRLLISTQDLFHGLEFLILGDIYFEKEGIYADHLLEKAQSLSSYIDRSVSQSGEHSHENIHVHVPRNQVLLR